MADVAYMVSFICDCGTTLRADACGAEIAVCSCGATYDLEWDVVETEDGPEDVVLWRRHRGRRAENTIRRNYIEANT